MLSCALLSLAATIWPPNARAGAYGLWACEDGRGRLLPDGDWFEVRDGPIHVLRATCGDPTARPATQVLAWAFAGAGSTPTDQDLPAGSGHAWHAETHHAFSVTLGVRTVPRCARAGQAMTSAGRDDHCTTRPTAAPSGAAEPALDARSTGGSP